MLGIGKPKPNFELAAHGKHPAFNDYFSLNTDSPLINALAVWVEKGTKLKGDNYKNRKIYSFRFWVKGIKKGEFVLGIVRDSSDRLGRTYPLLIMGKGFAKNWENRWNYVFNSFGPVFRSFEDITASRYESFKEFETRLTRINFPGDLYFTDPDQEQKEQEMIMDDRSRLPEAIMAWFRKDGEKGELSLPVATLLNQFGSYPFDTKERRLFGKKFRAPSAIFLGGLPEYPVLTIYTRPLKAEDFLNLFNLSGATQTLWRIREDKGEKPDGS